MEIAELPGALRAANALRDARQAAHNLLIFGNVLADDIGRGMVRLLDELAEPLAPSASNATLYGRLFGLLAEEAELYPEELVGDAWQNHLLDRLLADENAFSRKAQADAAAMGPALRAAALLDLQHLQALYHLPATALAATLRAGVASNGGGRASELVAWDGLRPLGRGPALHGAQGRQLKRRLASAADWGALVDDLAAYYARAGTGLFARFRAFRWVDVGEEGHLEGIARPDPVSLVELIGYDAERRLLIRNTEHFLAGYPANNVLLYGDRGTGKSSTIKALLNEYGEQGLRLVEVPKQRLADFARILGLLRERRERFIIFVDDLSFDEGQTEYKDLKAVLEGSLEARPANVLLYATSNRRHLVQERFRDRAEPGSDEIHAQDTTQEKLSLSDRFGITLTFLAPNQDRYLAIVEGLAAQRGLAITAADLRERALRWTLLHNARSGRTARQFVDHLTAELALQGARRVDG